MEWGREFPLKDYQFPCPWGRAFPSREGYFRITRREFPLPLCYPRAFPFACQNYARIFNYILT
jgi:hypothetical protein